MGCTDSKSAAGATEVKVVKRRPCPAGADCLARKTDYAHILDFSHPGDPDYTVRQPCKFGDDCPQKASQAHARLFSHPGDLDYTGPRKVCRTGAACTDQDPRHLRRFEHPWARDVQRKACKFGVRCFRQSDDHLAEFSHPGDADYRRGKVVFEDGVVPDFGTMQHLFDYCDPQRHGHFVDQEELRGAVALLARYREPGPLDVDRAWRDLGGDASGFVSFGRLAAWSRGLGITLPMGVDLGPAPEPEEGQRCTFVLPDGSQCDCRCFVSSDGPSVCIPVPSDGDGAPRRRASTWPAASRLVRQRSWSSQFCSTCGHKRFAHLGQPALGAGAGSAARSVAAPLPESWLPSGVSDALVGCSGGQVVRLDDAAVARFQSFFDRTHKATDNWTRDRGCALHHRACLRGDPMCVFRNKGEVPTGYRVVAVMRNVNQKLWNHYALNRGSIHRECSESCLPQQQRPSFEAMDLLETSGLLATDSPMMLGCNEWLLFHGTSPDKCEAVCNDNFRLELAGRGATWKNADGQRGTPLYGHGIYFADRITKADEYSEMVQADRRFAGCHTVLVTRVLGGRTQYCDTSEIDPAALQQQVIRGPFHSVLGDRVAKLQKPYREVVVYDPSQCYPEYVVYYKRLYN